MTNVPPRQQLQEAAQFLLSRVSQRPTVGVVLGSGLSGLAEGLAEVEAVPFADIPHLPKATVAGHRGTLLAGKLVGRSVALLQGRLHFYEGHSLWQVTFPVRLLHALGVRVLILTNAAGGLNPHFRPGDLMLIADHINVLSLAGINPLRGVDEESIGPRFVSLTHVYHPDLHKLAWTVGRELGLPLHSGVYAMVGGPSFETQAEIRFLRAVGADAVGMSTAPEAVVAAQLGMRVLGISCITNQALNVEHAEVSHEEVLARGREIEPHLGALIKGVISALPAEAAP